MSTVKVTITPYVTVFARTDVADTEDLRAWFNDSPLAPGEVKGHRPWRVESTEQEDDDTLVRLVGDPACWDLKGDEWDDYERLDVEGDIINALWSLPGAWLCEAVSVDAEAM